MDTVAENLRAIRNRVVIPRSVPGLVTRRVLVMEYLDGVPLTQLGSRVSNLSAVQKKMAMTRVRTPPVFSRSACDQNTCTGLAARARWHRGARGYRW